MLAASGGQDDFHEIQQVVVRLERLAAEVVRVERTVEGRIGVQQRRGDASMSWVKRVDVRGDVESRVDALNAKIDQRRTSATAHYDHPDIAAAVGSNLAAGNALKKDWFYSSLGIDWGDGDHETWYVSKAPVAATFASESVVHWTHWIGRLYTQVREHLEEHGKFPAALKYGPTNREVERAVGPLVRYQFTDGRLITYTFTDESGIFAPDMLDGVVADELTSPPLPSGFGLKGIVELIDLTQDDRIRGPMAGVYILTGGPGVGKTSVALHRIPYLILEQKGHLAAESPDAPRDFFRTDTTQVVVWKPHLVPYLKQCLSDLGFGDVGVHHIEDWVAKTLREYIDIGRGEGAYQIEQSSEPQESLRIKLGEVGDDGRRWTGLTEAMIRQFVTGMVEGRYLNPLADLVARECESMLDDLSTLFRGAPMQLAFGGLASNLIPTVAGIEDTLQSIRSQLDNIDEEAKRAARELNRGERLFPDAKRELERKAAMGTRVKKARDLISNSRTNFINALTQNYAITLLDFYQSSVVVDAVAEYFGLEESKRFAQVARERAAKRRLTRSDRYLLLWLIHVMTQTGGGSGRARALKRYSHTMVDEAQYYEPIVLRLLVDLALPPLRSVTIVGDLEQKISGSGGLIDWDDAGIGTDKAKVFRLTTNYRWSEAVFGFLDIYRAATGLRAISKPRRWASGPGMSPTITQCSDEDDQVTWLGERVSELRMADRSIAIVVPTGLGLDWRERVIGDLAGCDVRARWATGEDVRESQEQVVLTDYESIVGLEFDVVLLPGCERVLAPSTTSAAASQAAWVALTRARQYIGVSHVGPIGILDSEQFDVYRVT